MLALDKVHMEAARMEWCNELVLSSLLHHKQFIGVPKSMRGDKQGIDIAWWNRQQVCKNLYAASTAIRQATEELQVSTYLFGFVFVLDNIYQLIVDLEIIFNILVYLQIESCIVNYNTVTGTRDGCYVSRRRAREGCSVSMG